MFVQLRLDAGRISRRQSGSTEQGFAAVDAMVALVILSTTIVLALGAVETGRRAAVRSVETRKATALLQGLLEAPPGRVGAASGFANGFGWQVVTARANDNLTGGAVRLCDRKATAVNRFTRRHYFLASTEICPPEARP